jgi:3-phosphoshikimate 1-carboxyvinyltransferase
VNPSTALLRARPTGALRGRFRAPGDKSISHRALILGALARGETRTTGLLEGDDVLATAAAVRALGADVQRLGPGEWRIIGSGVVSEPAGLIDCGNSGTACRLLMGAVAGYPIRVTFTGDASLSRRPMDRVIAPLLLMGASVEGEAGRLPLELIGGDLEGIDYVPPTASAQVKSAILLAGLNAAGETSVTEPRPTRDHTEKMLRAFGAWVEVDDGPAGRSVRVRRSQLHGAQVDVPADPSSAAFAIVAALITPGSEVTAEGVLLNPSRTGLYETLREMGGDLTVSNERVQGGEAVGDLTARHSRLTGVAVPPDRAPSMIDEYPILAVAAAFADGETVMAGVGELRVKESDRIAATAAGLEACGVDVQEEPEALIVRGDGTPPRGGAFVESHGDHRIAMSHLVLGLAAQEPITVDGAEMIATSFPSFADLMRGLGAAIEPG